MLVMVREQTKLKCFAIETLLVLNTMELFEGFSIFGTFVI